MRQRLGFQLIAELKREDGTLPLVQLAPEWEQTFTTYQLNGERGQVMWPSARRFQSPGQLYRGTYRAGGGGWDLSGIGDLNPSSSVPAHCDECEGHRQPGVFL